jgi:hypothetical protein
MTMGNFLRHKPFSHESEWHSKQIQKRSEEPEQTEKQEKFDIRAQYQLLYFLGVLEPLKEIGTLEQKGQFFGALLNRSSQRARKPFSSINELLFSKNLAEAKNIKKDLLKVQKVLRDFGLEKKAKAVNPFIEKIDKQHKL